MAITKTDKQRGAITIYLLLVLVGMMVFLGVLVDTARIMAMQKAVERAANASTRSTMANYNPDLKDYGLFGLNDASAVTDDFSSYLKQNLGYEGDSGPSGFLDYQVVSVKADVHNPLAQRAVLKQQILDDMKYQAPIELAKNILDAFTTLEKTAEDYTKASDIIDLQEKRDKLLNEAKQELEKARHDNDYSIDRINSKVSELEAEFEAERQFKNGEIAEGRADDIKDTFSAIKTHIVGSAFAIGPSGVSELVSDAKKKIEEAQKVNQKIQVELNKHLNDQYNLNNPNKDVVPIQPKGDSFDENSTADVVIKDEYFESAKQLLDKYIKTTNNLEDTVNNALASSVDSINNWENPVISGINTLSDVSEKGLDSPPKPDNKLSDKDADKKQDEKQKEMDETLEKAKQEFKDYINAVNMLNTANNYFNNSKYDIAAGGTSPASEEQTEADKVREQVSENTKGIFSALKSISLDSRDKLFVDEYILTNFSSFTNEMSSHPLSKSEVEYMLYGSDQPAANLAAAFAELSALRLTVNTLYAFANGKTSVTLLDRLIEAAIYGVVTTVQDMKLLVADKQKVYFMGQFPNEPPVVGGSQVMPQLGYNDYLRLFLLIHPADENDRLKRIQSLISINLGDVESSKNPELLDGAGTYIVTESQVSIKLWFIPSFDKISTKLTGVKVEGNRAIITQKATVSY